MNCCDTVTGALSNALLTFWAIYNIHISNILYCVGHGVGQVNTVSPTNTNKMNKQLIGLAIAGLVFGQIDNINRFLMLLIILSVINIIDRWLRKNETGE